jgi:hypothetical protein
MSLGLPACGGSGGSPTTAPVPTPGPATVVVQPSPTPPPTSTAPAAAPSAALTVSPVSGQVPLTIEANLCQSTNPGGAALTYSFDYGDNTTANDPFCRLNHTYQRVGHFDVTGCVSDNMTEHPKSCAPSKSVDVAAADLGAKITVNTSKGCMIDVTVDVGALAGSALRVLSVSQVNVTFRRTSSSPQVPATRDGTSSRWLVQNYNIQPLGTGPLSVSVEAVDGGQTVGNGSKSASPSCP